MKLPRNIGRPQLWYNDKIDLLKIVYPNGTVEQYYFDNGQWTISSFIGKSQHETILRFQDVEKTFYYKKSTFEGYI